MQTIATQPWPSSTVGYEPTGIALTERPPARHPRPGQRRRVYRYAGTPQEPVSFVGLLPTDYYPADVAVVGGQVVVTNTRGIDARGPELTFSKGPGTVPATGHGTHSTTGVADPVRAAERPADRAYTATVFAQNGWGTKDVAQAKRQGQGPGRRCRPGSVTPRPSSTSSCW